jgi:hypothetical protein
MANKVNKLGRYEKKSSELEFNLPHKRWAGLYVSAVAESCANLRSRK